MPTSTPVWIGLGSNLGDRRAILDAAVRALSQTAGITVTRVSTYRETLPIGGPLGQGAFLNAAARLDTTLTPRELLAQTQRIEAELGRVRVVRWGERTLDIDLLIFGSKFVDEPDLKLPHPRLAVRRFVLEPLAEIAPDVVDTITRRTVADLLANLDRRPLLIFIDESIKQFDDTIGPRLAAQLAGVFASMRPTCTEFALNISPQSNMRWYRNQLARYEIITSIRTKAETRNCEGRWIVYEVATSVEATSRSWLFEFDGDTVSRGRNGRDESTLIVAAPNSRWPRRAGINHPPIYWPEATEPDTIVAEVVAVCRGIAGA